jgi:YfiH family protein
VIELPGYTADWPAPTWVRTWNTVREGGVSVGPYSSLNLGSRCGDNPQHVIENRHRVVNALGVEPLWLHQVHGVTVLEVGPHPGLGSSFFRGASPEAPDAEPQADASVVRQTHRAAVALTADCMPLLFCTPQKRVVAAAHAGWRGMAAGILEATLEAMAVAPRDIMVWLGPTIGPSAFEVGDEVRAVFVAQSANAARAFTSSNDPGNAPVKWQANLVTLARQRLTACGVEHIYGGNHCTASNPTQFYSHRRDLGVTGRMGSFIWMAED